MSIRPSAPLLAACLLAFCAGAAAQSNEQGLDPRNLDAKTPACRDFYQHANGGWLKANPVPPGFGSWGLFDELQQRNLLLQRQLLEQAASAPQDALDRLIGNLYASGMNEAAIEAAGAGPLAPIQQRIDKLKKPKDLAPLLADLHARGLPILFDFGANDDVKDPSRRIAYANQGGLGLPDRDYYLRGDAETKTLLAAYRAYVERLLTLSGSADAVRDAGYVLDFETRLATASLSLLQLRDPNNSYRPMPVKTLQKRFPALDWRKFLRAQGQPKLDSVSFAHEAFFTEIENLAKTRPPEQWRAYLRFHVANALAPYLSRGFQDAHEALYLRTLRGTKEPLPRWQRVRDSVDALVGQALGQRYVAHHFPEATHAAATTLVQNVRGALRSRIEQSEWLGTEATAKALEKLDRLDVKLGHSERWPSYDGLEFAPDAYANNVLAAVAWRHKRQMAAIGQPREDWQWPQPAHAVNAYYDPSRNQLVLPAGFLQPPLFDPAAEAAVNYGAAGALIGHELMHGFDAIGSTYGADGTIAPWLTPADANGFALRTKPLEAQYDAYTALGPVKVSGRLTLAENIADLAGLETAWAAFQTTSPDTKATQGTTPAQRFFLSWAQVWRRNYLDAELTVLLQTDVHAPAKFRVNGPLANLAPFAENFKCKAGTGFVRKAAERVEVW
jgi:putative endopeptidase